MQTRNESRPTFSASGKVLSVATASGDRVSGDVPIRSDFARPVILKDLLDGISDEAMIVDERSRLTPAQMVETKLLSRLKDSSLKVSHLQMRGLSRYRGQS